MAMMTAARIAAQGAEPEIAAIPRPEAGPGQVLVRIAACGLNFADLLMMKGEYQDTPAFPFTPGLELAGVVEAAGHGVTTLVPGNRVAVYSGSGGLAEFGAFDAANCLQIPDNMPFDVAAGFQIAYGTSHLALTRRARLAQGETLLVLGAAGGVGLTAVEIGREMGARVIAVARGEAKCAVAAGAGAEHVFDADMPELTQALRNLGGVDVIYDAVGGDLANAAARALRPEGRHLLIGFAGGALPKLAPNHMLVKNTEAIGFYWGGYLRFNPLALTDSLAELLRWYGNGRLHPHVGHRFPLSRIDEAYATLAGRGAIGKIVVTMDAGLLP